MALQMWGDQVNRAIGRRPVGPNVYTGSRAHVRRAMRKHGPEVVLDGIRALVEHPSNEALRRKATRGKAPFLKLRWWLKDIAEHADTLRNAPASPGSNSHNLLDREHQQVDEIPW